MTQVDLRSVGKRFGDAVAVASLDLSVASGELVALLGPSGCGKTTTLRMIAGLDPPDSGAILFDGQDVSATPVQDRNTGMVFQRYALFPHMTVERNVAFGLSVRGLPASEIAARVDEMLDVVQLTPYRTRFPAQLSGGQMQRVAIARTLVTRPRVLMLDEPFANLDTGLRAEMRQFVKDLQRRFGLTTLFVTHDQAEAMDLADRIAVMLEGRVAQFDTPERLYRTPASVAVARFMGARNLFPGRMRSGSEVETALGVLPCTPRDGLSPGTPVHVVLRAEALDMTAGPGAPSGLPGRIAARSFTGATVTYRVAVGGETVEVAETAREMHEVGTEVRLAMTPGRVWLLEE